MRISSTSWATFSNRPQIEGSRLAGNDVVVFLAHRENFGAREIARQLDASVGRGGRIVGLAGVSEVEGGFLIVGIDKQHVCPLPCRYTGQVGGDGRLAAAAVDDDVVVFFAHRQNFGAHGSARQLDAGVGRGDGLSALRGSRGGFT
jgi:hypothetical protein